MASIAVVGSLIYLGLQVRHAERSQCAIMQQGRADRTSQAALTVSSPELARIWQKGMATEPGLSPEEFAQWMLLCRAMFLSGEDSFMQHSAGQLAKPAFDSYKAGMRFYMAAPGMRAAWQLSAGQFGSEFRDFVDSTLKDTTATRRPDAYAEWKKLMQSGSSGPTS